jgi:hypothetical protein
MPVEVNYGCLIALALSFLFWGFVIALLWWLL